MGNLPDTKISKAKGSVSPDEQHPMPPPPRVIKEALRLDQQVRHPGPVWLDRVSPSELAHYGFGAEVRKAVQERERVLRDFGVDPADPRRFRQLRELERRQVGEAVARESGEQFLAHARDGFRGQLKIMRQGAGASYAVVSDGARFAVVPVTHDAKRQMARR